MTPFKIHPPRLTWNLKMMVWKMFLLFQGCILRFHVNLARCMGKFWVCLQYQWLHDFSPRGEDPWYPRLQEVLLHPWLCPLTKVKVSPVKEGGTFFVRLVPKVCILES